MTATCAWCSGAFTPRTTGGQPQRFCRPACRRACDVAGRRWVADALAEGTLTVEALRNGYAATRALLTAAISPTPLDEPEKPATLAPTERSDNEAAELLYALLGVSSEGWYVLASAMPQELFERLKRWVRHPPRSIVVARRV